MIRDRQSTSLKRGKAMVILQYPSKTATPEKQVENRNLPWKISFAHLSFYTGAGPFGSWFNQLLYSPDNMDMDMLSFIYTSLYRGNISKQYNCKILKDIQQKPGRLDLSYFYPILSKTGVVSSTLTVSYYSLYTNLFS